MVGCLHLTTSVQAAHDKHHLSNVGHRFFINVIILYEFTKLELKLPSQNCSQHNRSYRIARITMPGTRTSTAGLPRKSSVQALKSRLSTRPSSLSAEIPDEGPPTHLRTQICTIFANAQRDTTTQRKLVVSLRKIQEACCYEPVQPQPSKQRRRGKKVGERRGRDEGDLEVEEEEEKEEALGEEQFNEEVGRCVLRVLTVKKSEPVGDRVVKFLGLFLSYASEKGTCCFYAL